MDAFSTFFGWVGAAIAASVGLSCLFTPMGPTVTTQRDGQAPVTRDATWRDTALLRGAGVTALSVSFLLVSALTGARLGFVHKVLSSYLLILLACALAFASFTVVASRARLRQSAEDADTDLLSRLTATGMLTSPSGTVKDAITAQIGIAIARTPWGWLFIAAIPLAGAAWALVGVWNLWTAGSPVRVDVPDGVSSVWDHSWALFGHVVTYLVLIPTLIGALLALARHRNGIGGPLFVAVLAGTTLAAFIIKAGAWV